MPLVIPYDPTLILGNIVSQEKLEILTQISALQAPVDAAEDVLNSYMAMKRSLDMTIQEIVNMSIDPSSVNEELEQVKKQISDAVIEFVKRKLEAEKKVQPLRAKIQSIGNSIESPIDYNKSALVSKMPLASDSLKMNCQYFALDSNQQDSNAHAATIAGFVADQIGEFGASYSSQMKASAQSQMSSQYSRHSISGTLVVSITCTHRNAAFFAPLVLDADKAVRVWNKLFPGDMIKVNSPESLAVIEAQQQTREEKSFSILSGATYGSCFVGMVHILNTTDTTSNEAMTSLATSLQEQANIGSWWASASGGFGISSSFSDDMKNLLSSQNVTSHCTLSTLGVIPSIKSNQVAMAVKAFSDDDAAKSMAALQKLQNATAGEMDTIDSAAASARTGQQLISIQSAKVSATLSGLADIDNGNNKVIDTNSLMDALEDYIAKCVEGSVGVPINFYTKPITKSQLAQMWLAKYYPGKFKNAGSGDDSGSNQQGQSAGGNTSSGQQQ